MENEEQETAVMQEEASNAELQLNATETPVAAPVVKPTMSKDAAAVLRREKAASRALQEAQEAKREAEAIKQRYTSIGDRIHDDPDAVLKEIGWSVDELSDRLISGKKSPDKNAQLEQQIAELKRYQQDASMSVVNNTILSNAKDAKLYPYLSRTPDDEIKTEVFDVIKQLAQKYDVEKVNIFELACKQVDAKYKRYAERYAPPSPPLRPTQGANTITAGANVTSKNTPKTREERLAAFYLENGIK